MTRKFVAAALACAATRRRRRAGRARPPARAATRSAAGTACCRSRTTSSRKRDAGTPTGRRLALAALGDAGATRTACGSTRASGTAPTASAPASRSPSGSPGSTPARVRRATGSSRSPTSARACAKRQPVVLIDARTGKRQLIWAELDSVRAVDASRALLIRPGEEPARGPALRRRAARPADRERQARSSRRSRSARCATGARPARRRSAPPAGDASASSRAASAPGSRAATSCSRGTSRSPAARRSPGRCCTCATTAFAALGDANLADLKPEGRSPAFTIDTRRADARRRARDRARDRGHGHRPVLPARTPAARSARASTAAPDGLPEQKPGNTYAAFVPLRRSRATCPPAAAARCSTATGCSAARSTRATPPRRSSRRSRTQQGFTVCGTYWSGLSAANGGEDTAQAAAAIQDLSKFGAITDRLQQGMLNMLFLGRAMVAADGFRAQPAFAGAFDASAAAVLRRQLAGRDRGRRADRGRAGLRPRGARRAGHELLDAAAALGRLRAVPRAARRRVHEPARPGAHLLAAHEPVGPRRVERLRAAHDGASRCRTRRRTRCCCTSRSATTRWRRSPPR